MAAGFSVKDHPDAHIALFMSKPFSYTNPHVWAAYLFVMLALAITAAVLYYRLRTSELYGAESKPAVQSLTGLHNFAEVAGAEQATGDEDEAQPAAGAAATRLAVKNERLLYRLKVLEEQYQAGTIDEQQYQTSRDKLKQLLVQVKLQMKELT